MYTHIWNKYLPVIRVLLKRALKDEQFLQLNASDFDKTGNQKKTGFKFTLEFRNGKVGNMTGLSPIAKELSAALLQDQPIQTLLGQAEYHLSMNAKFGLGIKVICTYGDAPEQPLIIENAGIDPVKH